MKKHLQTYIAILAILLGLAGPAFPLTNATFEATPFSSGWTIVGAPVATPGLIAGSTQGARFSATGQSLAQNVSWGAEWQIENYFAIQSTANRAYSHIINIGAQSGINLRYDTAGFAVFNGITSAWVPQPALGTISPSIDANGDGDLNDVGDTKNVYRIRITGHSFGTAGWNYEIDVSEANSTEFTRGVANLSLYQTASGAASYVTSVIYGSVNGSNPGFWIDDVRSHEEIPASPTIRYFLTSAGNLNPPATAQLSWLVENADSVTLSGTGNVPLSGSATVSPTTTTTYTLTAVRDDAATPTVAIIVIAPGATELPPVITEFQAADGTLRDEDGDRPDWIELFNPNAHTLVLTGYSLTDTFATGDDWVFPATNIPPGGYLVVFASQKNRALATAPLHTNFSLAGAGEYLALHAPGGAVVQRFPADYPTTLKFPKQFDRASYGLDGSGNAKYFKPGTPGAANGTAFDGVVADTNFSIKRGIYLTPQTVTISTTTPGAEIRYTTTNAAPTATTGTVYTAPITISTTTTLRVAAFRAGYAPTNVDTNTYIFPADVVTQPTMSTTITQHATYGPQMIPALTDIPSVSIVTPSTIVNGSEVGCSFEYIPTTGVGTHEDGGVENFGGAFTNFAKKSFRVKFKAEFGGTKITIPGVFTNYARGWKPVDTFDELELRSGSHDMKLRGFSMSNMFSDAVMFEMGQFSTHGRFVHMYLNGSYHGMYHLRERWGGDHHNAYFGGPDASVESINGNLNVGGWAEPGDPYDGDGTAWARIKALRTSYSAVRPYLNVKNYVDFMVMWMFGNSENEWRNTGPNDVGSGQKFWLNDADGFLAINAWDSNSNNTARTASPNTGRLNGDGPGGILSALHYSGDSDFQILVADRIHRAMFGNGPLTPAANIARLTPMCAEIERAFYADAARWSTVNTSHYRTPAEWLTYRDQTFNSFFPTRTATVISQLQAVGYYPTQVAPAFVGGTVTTGTVVNFPVAGSTVYFTTDGSDPRLPGGALNPSATAGNSTTIQGNTWLRARSRSGATWSALNEAFFTVNAIAPGDVVISEIHYNPQGDDDSEFIELWNPTNRSINLRGAKFTAGISYDFPDNRDVPLAPGGRLILCASLYSFQQRYGIEIPVEGVYFDRLGNDGDTLTLSFGATQLLSLQYQDIAPWPQSADGDGYSLILTKSAAPTAAASWRTSTAVNGNPGATDTAFPFTGTALADFDKDGIPALIEHFFGTSETTPNPLSLIPGIAPDGKATITFTRRLAVDDLSYTVESTPDLALGWNTTATRTAEHNNGNGTVTETWTTPSSGQAQFLRVRVTQ
jgi:hypothetical protein